MLRAMEKWPDVPDVFGKMKLDRRGRWLIEGLVVKHPRLRAFINRNYEQDEAGRWFFQNGPQRVFIEIEGEPWVLHMVGPNRLQTHNDLPVENIERVLVNEDAEILIDFDLGRGLLWDQDLVPFLDHLTWSDAGLDVEQVLEKIILGVEVDAWIQWLDRRYLLKVLG